MTALLSFYRFGQMLSIRRMPDGKSKKLAFFVYVLVSSFFYFFRHQLLPSTNWLLDTNISLSIDFNIYLRNNWCWVGI